MKGCFSTSRDFSSLYEKQDYEDEFVDHKEEEEIESKNNLKLDKSHLPLKEALRMMGILR